MALIRHRITARVLLRAQTGRFLLLLTHWSPEAELEPRWVTPGGGVEAGEDLGLAAARELFEETGLEIQAEQLGTPIACLEFNQFWKSGDHETGLAHIFYHPVAAEFEIDQRFWTQDERRDILAVKWWGLSELIASGEQVGPPGLVEVMGGIKP